MTPTRVATALRVFPSDSAGDAVSSSFASPKSNSLAYPFLETRMFSGLTSRCRMPAWWAHAKPSAIPVMSSAIWRGEGFSLRAQSRNMGPSMNSVTRYCCPSMVPAS